jgi:hypothetical protein
MKNIHYPLRAGLIAALAFVAGVAFLADTSAATAKPHATTKSRSEPAKPVGEPVEYKALENHVGAQIAIETTLKTTRTGTLLKWTQPALTLQIGSAAGSIELTVPRETIKSITLLSAAAESAATPPAQTPPNTTSGTSGAKKN